MSPLMPTLLYDDAPAMIDWLCGNFGFARHAVYEDEQGGIGHAELTLGEGMIMMGTARENDFGALQGTPRRLGGTTQSVNIVVSDPDAVHARVVAAGGVIVMPLSDMPYGGRSFSCRDPEGHLWHVGSYDPWTAKPVCREEASATPPGRDDT